MQVVRRDPDKGYIDGWLWVPKRFTNPNAVMSALSFQFTDSYTGEQKVLFLWKEAAHHMVVPRMVWTPGQLPYEVVDCRPQAFKHVDFKSKIKLDHRPDEAGVLMPSGDDVQRISIAAMQAAMGGVLQLACGKGKTVIALEHIARNKVPALVVVDNTNLLYQWKREIETLLDVPGGIGFLMSGKDDWEGRGIVLATYQTLGARGERITEACRRYFGGVYFDEGHHVSAPVFSRGVHVFYGKRYSLTATPERDDGWHIIADMHIGPVLHKDLRPMMKPNIYFFWTGLELDLTDPRVQRGCYDVNGELHLSKIKSYLGTWRDRMWLLMNKTIMAVQAGRKTLLLSDSKDEVINLMAMWTRGPHTPLISDIPYPTTSEVGETLLPYALDSKEAKKLMKKLESIWKGKEACYEARLNELMMKWTQYLVYKKLEALHRKRRRAYLDKLIDEPSSAGLMTQGVKPEVRQRFLDERAVVFAITKYGKEGLDCEELDTVLVSSLFSSKNGLQQLKGRPTRPKPGKKTPTIVLFVDGIGQMRGMEQKLMRHLRQWPHEEGGPYEFELINYPKVTSCKTKSLIEAFGR